MRLLTKPTILALTMLICIFCIAQKAQCVIEYALFSWGDYACVWGGTDGALDDPNGITRMLTQLKNRGYTGMYWRTDIAQMDPNQIIHYSGTQDPLVELAVSWVDAIEGNFNVMQTASTTASNIGLELYAYHPTVYSDGAPGSLGWPYQHKYVANNNNVLTVDRSQTLKQYFVREYAYPGARADKVNEFKYLANHGGVRNFIPDMRTEAAQISCQADLPSKADQFGFNQIIVDAMSSLYGVNILTDSRFDINSGSFDPCNSMVQNWHALRGSYLTQLFSDIRTAMNAIDPNIKITARIPGDYVGPELGNWKADWRTWVNNGLINNLVVPVSLAAGWNDTCPRGYLTDLKCATQKGVLPYSRYRNYINSSNHPEVKLIEAGGWERFPVSLDASCDGWQTNWVYEPFDIAWYQRWEQWKQDIKDFGYIKYISQDFESFDVNSRMHGGAMGCNRYVPAVRACPGAWVTLGDGSDNFPTATSTYAHSGSKSLRIARDNTYQTSPKAMHTNLLDHSTFQYALDNCATNGRIVLEYWLYRVDGSSTLAVFPQNSYASQYIIGVYVNEGAGAVSYWDNSDPRYWVPSGATHSAGAWQMYTMDVNLTTSRYSAYQGPNREVTLCTNISYSMVYNRFDQIFFSTAGSAGNRCCIDDVVMKWYPDLYVTAKGTGNYLSESFESKTAHATIDNTPAETGGSWILDPDSNPGSFYTEDRLSWPGSMYNAGYKCLAAAKTSANNKVTVGSTAKLTLSASSVFTVDFDVYVTSGYSFKATLREASAGPTTASIYANAGSWQYWSTNAYVSSGVSVVPDEWTHVQMALDSSNRTYKVVVQPCAQMPVLLGTGNWDSGTNVGDTVYLSLEPLGTNGNILYFDNISITTPQSAPAKATSPSPSNSATNVSAAATLSWTAGSGATGRNVYFGTTSPGTFRGTQSGTTYNPGTMTPSTTYYWRIDEVGNGGTTTGDVWSFTTAAVPVFVAAGNVASGTGTITPALPAGIATNDILLLFLETANQAISITNQNGGTWTQVTNSPQGTGTAGSTTATRLTVFWSRYNGTQGAPTASDSGDHQLGRIIAIRGATTSGNPWDVTAGGVEAVSDTSGSIPGATTTVGNTLVVAAIATALPDADGTANFSSWANGNLTSVTECTDNTTSQGNGGGLGIATGIKATAGAYGNTTVTVGSAAYKGMMSIALKP